MDEELESIRREIDGIDRELIALLEKRVRSAKKIGRIKREKNIPITDNARERQVLENVSGTALEKEFVEDLFTRIISYCKGRE